MARLRRVHVLGLSLSLLALAALPAFAWAESLPASVRACASETDSLRRLVCYDREVARYTEPKPNAPATQAAPSTRAPTAPPAQAASPPPPPAPAALPTPAVQTASSTAPAAAKSAAAAPSPGHIAARVASIDHSPSEMVLHLDNGQVWQQTQAASGDLSLQVGDAVIIDKHFGSFWLTGPHVSGMKVRQKT